MRASTQNCVHPWAKMAALVTASVHAVPGETAPDPIVLGVDDEEGDDVRGGTTGSVCSASSSEVRSISQSGGKKVCFSVGCGGVYFGVCLIVT